MLNTRMYYVINLLNSYKGMPLSSSEIAEKTGSSTRTIKRDIIAINEELAANGATILSDHHGYYLVVENARLFYDYYNALQRNFRSRYAGEELTIPIIKILLTSEYVTQDRLVDTLFVSKATLQKTMPLVRKHLGHVDIELKSRPHYGYYVTGDEINIRNYMADILFPLNNTDISNTVLFSHLPVGFDEIKNITSEVLRRFKISLNESFFNSLLRYIIISYLRIRINHTVDLSSQYSPFTLDSDTVLASESLSEHLSEICNVDYIEQEILYLAYIIGNSFNGVAFRRAIQEMDFGLVIKEMLFNIKKIYGCDFSDDEALYAGISEHLYRNFSRYHLHAAVLNPLMMTIKGEYIEAYNYSIICCNVLQDNYHLYVTEEDIGYLALHFEAALERRQSHLRYRVLVLFDGSKGAKQLLYTLLNKHFPQLDIDCMIPPYGLDNHKLHDIDFIISVQSDHRITPYNLDSPSTSTKIPLIKIEQRLSEENILAIQDCINHYNGFAHLKGLFRRDLFFNNLHIETKQEALCLICDKMIGLGYITAEEKVSIINRENISSTEINDLVAIPHSIQDSLNQSVIGIGILKKPIFWGQNNVQLVLVCAINPAIQVNTKAFPLLHKLTANTSRVHNMLLAENYEQFIDTLFQDNQVVI